MSFKKLTASSYTRAIRSISTRSAADVPNESRHTTVFEKKNVLKIKNALQTTVATVRELIERHAKSIACERDGGLRIIRTVSAHTIERFSRIRAYEVRRK